MDESVNTFTELDSLVSDALWTAAQARMRGTRTTVETAAGERPIVRRDLESPHLLSGFGRCGTCGWSMTVVTRSHGKQRKAFLGCLSHHKRGPHICPNGLLTPLEKADRAVLMAMQTTALARELAQRTVDDVFRQLEPPNLDAQLKELRQELASVEQKIARLTAAIETGGHLKSLTAQLHAREQEREGLLGRIATVEGNRLANINREAVEQRVDAQLDVWRQALLAAAEAQSTPRQRQLLRELLTGPLMFTPDGEDYVFKAPTDVGDVIAGAVADADRVQRVKHTLGEGRAHKVASPTGDDGEWMPIDAWMPNDSRAMASRSH